MTAAQLAPLVGSRVCIRTQGGMAISGTLCGLVGAYAEVEARWTEPKRLVAITAIASAKAYAA